MNASDPRTQVTSLRRACRYAEAEEAIKKLLDGADAHVELGRIAFERGRSEIASRHFARALELDPHNEPAQAWRVAGLSRQRQYTEARAIADAVLAQHPEAHLVRIARGRVAEDETDEEQYLLDELETVLAAAPDHLEALEVRVRTLGKLNRPGDAAAAAEKALECHPDAAELYVAWGEASAYACRFTTAIEKYDQALEIRPEYVEAHYRKLQALNNTHHYDKTFAHAEAAVERLPGASRLYFTWGVALHRIQDFAGALAKFEHAAGIDPDRANHHRWRAVTLDKMDRGADGAEVLRSALAASPDSVSLLVEQAWHHHRLGDLEAAVAIAEKAVALAPTDGPALTCHVTVLRTSHRFAEAEAAVRSAIRVRPGDAELHNDLGWIHADQDQDEGALHWFRRASELEPFDPGYLTDVSRAVRWLYRHDEARELLAEASAQLPESPEIPEQRALLLEDTGATADAVEIYTEMNRRWPQYPGAWIGRIRLLSNQERQIEAEQVAQQAVELNPCIIYLRSWAAGIQQKIGGPGAAAASLRSACTALPGRLTLSLELSWYLRGAGDYSEARAVLWQLPEHADVLIYRIGLLRDVREHEQAVDVAVAGRERFPRDLRFRRILGDIRADLGEDEQALAEFEANLALNPTDRASLRGKLLCLRRLRRFDEAVRILLGEIARRPNYVDLRVELARTYARMERREEAITVYEKALEIDPRDGSARLYHARALWLAGRLEDAEAALTTALDLLPGNASLVLEMGDLRDAQNRHEEALTWFDRGLALAPRSVWALVSKSAALRSLGRFGEAERLLAPELVNPTVTAAIVIEWGWVLRDRGELNRAGEAFERALGLAVGKRSRADARHGLGWVAFSARDFEQAAVRFRAAIAENPQSRDARVGLAWTLVHEGEPNGEDEAERLCLAVLAEAPRRHLAHTCLGVLYARQGNLPQAEYHLRRSIEIDPYGGSYVDLGALFAQMGRFEEAETLLLKALERNWYDSQAHIELGALHLQRDFDGTDDPADARRAARHFRQALVIEPTRGAAAIGLSLALVKSPGDLPAAERVLRDALRRQDCDQPRWQLLVALARLLIGRGDETQRRDLHLEALSTARQAIELAAGRPDPHYVAGVAAYKAGESGPEAQARPYYRRRALHHFRRCLHHDPEHIEARRVMTLAEQSLAITRNSLAGSAMMIAVAGGLLITLWLGFFLTGKVTTVMISTLTPILVGLVALGFVLPFLVRLKLPGGVEADLSASLNQVSSGPTGEVSIGPGRLVGNSSDSSPAWSPLGTGPRGELPRLG
ncbi:tetratricopeptide repeat protein [Amycolatopsis sp. A133]|uniref:tetratricopeptide repeat protein n=1 Tax=Amycolatopsis sp. A133 TaxID=3064472 RepID=UPI0027F71167|nr:tetratricopeptide repeat protein [Amycolatopsis sp. A133]MDQ7808871.1 tetratricopeptide repeat protein [Amycolatopsis sp. A133]